ncbi:MAG: NADH-quinone oxidoreductase subunit I, partial [Candidatus Omnitrophica bacterium]|nr:NADH-quinone oxidoreductase subunit I [Candidatus Omnitrophota bacterium]
MFHYLKEVIVGFWSLVVGMGVTIRYFFKRPVTVIYPKERIPIKRFKGPIEFVVGEKTQDHLCISCN